MHSTDPYARFARVLGDELRSIRLAHGLTRRDFHTLLVPREPEREVSVQTLASYEQGTRRVTLERFMRLCAILGEDAAALLHRTVIRVFGVGSPASIRISLPALAATSDPVLAPIKQWAVVVLRQQNPTPDHSPVTAELTPHAITQLARIADTTTHELTTALRALPTPNPPTPRHHESPLTSPPG